MSHSEFLLPESRCTLLRSQFWNHHSTVFPTHFFCTLAFQAIEKNLTRTLNLESSPHSFHSSFISDTRSFQTWESEWGSRPRGETCRSCPQTTVGTSAHPVHFPGTVFVLFERSGQKEGSNCFLVRRDLEKKGNLDSRIFPSHK